MIRIRDISLPPGSNEQQIRKAAAKQLKCMSDAVLSFSIVKKSVDARKKNDVRIIYTIDVAVRGDEAKIVANAKNTKLSIPTYRPYIPPTVEKKSSLRPVIAGFGPAGMFAALLLSEAGLNPIVLERGSDAVRRKAAVDAFWKGGPLDPHTNVQFGEGGAGMFSDGKLNTGIKDFRTGYVLKRMVEFGAPDNILYDAKPHVGTDCLYQLVQNLRRHIISLGADIRFDTCLVGIEDEKGRLVSVSCRSSGREYSIETEALILAIGHSARDTFRLLNEGGIPMEPKPFSMGVRIEQTQKAINRAQYGQFAEAPNLPPADYKLSCRLPDGSSAYTFCMCPGGYVVAAASEEGGVVTNGMSYSGRDGENANSALLVTLHPEDFPYDGVLGGVRWQEELEKAAYRLSGGSYLAPAQLVGDFLKNVPSRSIRSVKPTYRPGVFLCNLRDILPNRIADTISGALPLLDGQLKGFADPDGILTAPETRSSSPVRILRDENCQSSLRGLYPCGEGAGYAGGIMSAAVDGLRCAEAVIKFL